MSGEKIVVFDLMGTLFEEAHIVGRVLVPFLKERGYQVDYREAREQYIKYSAGEISEEEFWNSLDIEEFKDTQRDYLDRITLKEGAVDTVEEVRGDYRTAVLSNVPSEWGHCLLEKNDLKKQFSVVVLSGDFNSRKPAEGIYNGLMEQFDVSSDCFYFVDNELRDLRGGEKLGMNTIWVENDREEIAYSPDYTVEDIGELPDLMDRIEPKIS